MTAGEVSEMTASKLSIPPGASPAVIIEALRANYVTSARDSQLRQVLDELLAFDDDGSPLPQPARFGTEKETNGMIVIGDSGAGKTTAIAHTLREHPAFSGSVGQPGEAILRPGILKVDVPSPSTLKNLGTVILQKSGYGNIAKSRTEAEIWAAVRHRLKVLGISILWLDEAQDLMRSNSENEKMNICNTLKTLCKEEHAVVVILSGIETLERLTKFDPQIKTRFSTLRLGAVSPSRDGKGIKRMISAYCEAAGLEAPRDPDLVPRLFHAYRNQFGTSIKRVVESIRLALLAEDKALSIQHFAAVYARHEGCRDSQNIFLVEKWASIQPSTDDDEEEMTKHRKPTKGKKRK
jgi:hypothetical protein